MDHHRESSVDNPCASCYPLRKKWEEASKHLQCITTKMRLLQDALDSMWDLMKCSNIKSEHKLHNESEKQVLVRNVPHVKSFKPIIKPINQFAPVAHGIFNPTVSPILGSNVKKETDASPEGSMANSQVWDSDETFDIDTLHAGKAVTSTQIVDVPHVKSFKPIKNHFAPVTGKIFNPSVSPIFGSDAKMKSDLSLEGCMANSQVWDPDETSFDIDTLHAGKAVTSTQIVDVPHVKSFKPIKNHFAPVTGKIFNPSVSPIFGSDAKMKSDLSLEGCMANSQVWDPDETSFDIDTLHAGKAVTSTQNVDTHLSGAAYQRVLGEMTPPAKHFRGDDKGKGPGCKSGNAPSVQKKRGHSPQQGLHSSFHRHPSWKEPSPPKYKFVRPLVRKNSDKKKLRGATCSDCSQAHCAILGMEKTDERYGEIIQRVSKHRSADGARRVPTPPGYWDPGWPGDDVPGNMKSASK